ncbi:AAA family ATPase [Dehalobacter sp. DCM]|nr:AAA family ATPase [Dehalobacter sp. DCM]
MLKKSGLPPRDEDKDQVQEIIRELDNMIGLESVKKLIHELYAFVEIQKKREKEKLNTEPLVLHTIFSGNPGTGKTTVARLIGRLYKEMGVLSRGHIVECERADLVGEYIGHTANKTRDMVKKALGGVLFIDEAYSLSRGGEKDFGKESIDALVKAMEDNKEDFILILAGYKLEMEIFVQSNPGLRSRFPIHIVFPDYTLEELTDIGEQMLASRQYEFSLEAKHVFKRTILNMSALYPYAGNARLVRNIVEKAIRKQAVRLYRQKDLSREDLILITEEDLRQQDSSGA